MDSPRIYNHFDRLRTAQLRLAAAALILMMLTTVADVTLRYAFNHPIRGAYDFVQTMLVIFVFHGMSTAFLQRRNIVIDLIDNVANRFFIAALIRLSDWLTISAIGLFAYAMITPAWQSYSYGELKLELQIPIWWLWAIALLGIIGAILSAIGALFSATAAHHNEPV